MKNFVFRLVVASLFACSAGPVIAQVASTANGGSGGTGGSASGGTAAGGTASNTSNIGSATSNYQGGTDVSVNYITPAGAAGVNGLAPGIDPGTNHFVNDTNLRTSGTTRIKNTPDVNLGGPASGACNGLSGGLGVGVPGLAIGGNVSTVDKGCEARETARVAAMLGRMDVANAILENMDVVVTALKARSDRETRDGQQNSAAQAQSQRARDANAAIAQAVQMKDDEALRVQQLAARDREADAMRAQQQAGIEAIARQATMAKVNDTLTFTGKLTHGEEKTAQEVMVENLSAKQQAATQKAAEAERIATRAAAVEPALVAARAPEKAGASRRATPVQKLDSREAKRQTEVDGSDAHAAMRSALGLVD